MQQPHHGPLLIEPPSLRPKVRNYVLPPAPAPKLPFPSEGLVGTRFIISTNDPAVRFDMVLLRTWGRTSGFAFESSGFKVLFAGHWIQFRAL